MNVISLIVVSSPCASRNDVKVSVAVFFSLVQFSTGIGELSALPSMCVLWRSMVQVRS